MKRYLLTLIQIIKYNVLLLHAVNVIIFQHDCAENLLRVSENKNLEQYRS